LEKKDEEKKQKRKTRPKKKSAQQTEVKDVDARLQELLLGIESECAMFPPASSCPQTTDRHDVVPGMDIVDLSSPSPPLRACKSQKFIGSTTATMSGIDLQCQSLLTDMTESQSSTQSSGAQNLESQSSTQSSDAQYLESQSSSQSSDALKFTLDDDLIDLSSPLPLVADRPCSLQDLPPCNKAERRALTDLSNLPEKSSMLGALDDRHKAGTGNGCVPVEASPLHGAQVSSSRSNAQINSLAESEAGAIDLCSPSPAIVNRRRNVKLDKNDIDISEADSSVKSPEDDEHERKARELRLFLKSIRDEL
jgi:flap endonuclease GEN